MAFPPFAPPPTGGDQGDKMMDIVYLVAIMADLTSETWHELANDGPGHHAVPYRTEIHSILTKISKILCGLWALLGAHALERAGKRCCERRLRSNRVL